MSNLMDEALRKKLREVSYNQGFVDGVKMCERRIEKINDLINEKTTTMTRQEAASALEIILKEDEWLPPKAYKAISLAIDALNETDRSQWITCSERMPEETDSVFSTFYGTDRWRSGMMRKRSDFVLVTKELEDGRRTVSLSRTNDGEWGDGICSKVLAWMPMPEPYQPEDNND